MTTTARTQSIAILVCSSSGTGGVSSKDGIPVVVWTNQVRTARDSPEDKWKHTLTYYEFLDDSRWTHLDALLTRLAPVANIHVGSSENISKNTGTSPNNKSKKQTKNSKTDRMERLVQSLQVFLETRDDLSPSTSPEDEQALNCQVHLHVPIVDATRLESIVSQLLMDDPDVQLAYRGNVQLAHNNNLQQGLCLWLRGEGLMATNSSNTTAAVDDLYVGSMQLYSGVLTSHLTLDRTAAQCIHLLPPPNVGVASIVGGNASNNSIYGILSQPCVTKMGKDKMQLWVRQPLVELDKILERQASVEALVSGVGKDLIHDALRTFSGLDLNNLATTLGLYGAASASADDDEEKSVFGNTKKALQALYNLYLLSNSKLPQLLEATNELLEQQNLNQLPTFLEDARQGAAKLTSELERCQGLVEAVLDLDQAPREFLIKPAFNEVLMELSQELKEVQDQVQEEYERMQEEWNEETGGTSSIRLEPQDDSSSWQFRLPNTNDTKTLQGLVGTGSKIYIHRVLKNGVYFSTGELRQLGSKNQDLQKDYQKNSRQVVRDAMQIAATYETVVERASELVSTLDVLCAFAHVAAYSPNGYCKPVLTDGDDDGMGITLEEARHPCVELQQGVTEYIANDISLRFGQSNFLLVTGPNMGGKSTYIRALGAIVTMAQIGSYVPCKAATINICHSILARVGAGDLQERGISTFMAEMLESSSILRTATKRSLLIVDELGRGTSTFDGYGLARAISEYIYQQIGCMVVFATHFHELTALENQFEGVQNCHVTACKGDKGLTFLYKVQPGPCLESFGIQVAEMANVPVQVIEDAKRKAEQLENFQYKNKRKKQDTNKQQSQATAEMENAKFCKAFRNFELPSFLNRSFESEGQKKEALLQLLTAS